MTPTAGRRRVLTRQAKKSEERRARAEMNAQYAVLAAEMRTRGRLHELSKSGAYSVTLYRRWIEEDRAAGRDTSMHERLLKSALARYSPREIERARRKHER